METTPLINSTQSYKSRNYNPLAYRGSIINNSNEDYLECCIDIIPTTDNYVYKDNKTNFIYVRYYQSFIEKVFFFIKFVVNMICAGFLINFFIKFKYY